MHLPSVPRHVQAMEAGNCERSSAWGSLMGVCIALSFGIGRRLLVRMRCSSLAFSPMAGGKIFEFNAQDYFAVSGNRMSDETSQ
jgi:hypothetical protein